MLLQVFTEVSGYMHLRPWARWREHVWLQARNLQGLPIVDGFMGGENGTREIRLRS